MIPARNGTNGLFPDGHYASGGVQLHDYWFYLHGRWVFDLPLSNPDSVELYKLTPQRYVAELGCAPGASVRGKDSSIKALQVGR